VGVAGRLGRVLSSLATCRIMVAEYSKNDFLSLLPHAISSPVEPRLRSRDCIFVPEDMVKTLSLAHACRVVECTVSMDVRSVSGTAAHMTKTPNLPEP
jgi:hypothetical protein